MLSDGLLDEDEQADLLQILSEFTGEPAAPGEILKSTTLPLDDPPPPIVLPRHFFLFTGTCASGPRRRCQEFIVERGGENAPSITRKLDYLVIGTYVTKSWMHENHGRKIEKAMEYRERYGRPAIISEDALGFPFPV